MHGTRTSSAIWSHQVAAMERWGHESVAVDLPGHGSRSSERFTLQGALETIDRAVDGCASPPVVVGLSLGGYTTLAYAAQHGHKVAGVVLSGCSTEIRGMPLGAYRALSVRIVRMLRPTGSTWHVVADMLAALQGYSAVSDLRRLLVPVWLVNGRRDVLRFGERRYLAASPLARLTVVPGAGHDVNSHAPETFNRILLGVLHDLGSVARAVVPRLTHAA
ncbi:alpha/beta fold hydrolase [Actinotalea sp. K2]|uniref:alpha/beta fold hydrolase n=1 Tax=Actinotalea sp. K2 TaxID=2939438 RepID=UPI00201728BE|nr:alpha/beta fold hydrolase [Actinotalea sp. K2]MCL3861923.1 alpha/beta fold hydrolase [Actinotalea sp. K2]